MAISLKAARVNANMTRKDVAEKLECSVFVIANYENGTTVPPVDIAQKLCGLYGVSMTDVIFMRKSTIK